MTSEILYGLLVILITLGSAVGTYIYRRLHSKSLQDSTIILERWTSLINDLSFEVTEKTRLTLELKDEVEKIKQELLHKEAYIKILEDKNGETNT